MNRKQTSYKIQFKKSAQNDIQTILIILFFSKGEVGEDDGKVEENMRNKSGDT